MDFQKVVGILVFSANVPLSATVPGCSAVPCPVFLDLQYAFFYRKFVPAQLRTSRLL